jgi:hypothetical protein
MQIRTKLLAATTILAAAAITWSVGVSTNLFADPAFASFWWISREVAYQAQYASLASGLVALCGVFYLVGKPKK